MYSAASFIVLLACTTWGVPPPPPPPPPLPPSSSCSQPLPKMGLAGVNLEASFADPLLNVSACCAACDTLPSCLGWTLNAKQKLCFLKSSVGLPKRNVDAVASGLKGGVRPDPSPYPPAPPSKHAPKNAKNVLFIPVDDMRPSQGVYGQPVHTPNFDRLGAAGTVFSRAFANFAWCSPSRNSFMSGRRPDRTKAWDFGTHFRLVGPRWIALPEFFKINGYFTTGVGKLYHKNNPPNFDPQSWSNISEFPIPYGNKRFGGQSGEAQGPELFDKCDETLVDLALSRMSVAAELYHRQAIPFFLGVGLREPHLPYNYPESYDHLYEPASTFDTASHPNLTASQPVLGWFDQQHKGAVSGYTDVAAAGGVNLSHLMPVSLAQKIRRSYYATISYTDAQMGRLLDALDSHDLTPTTVIVTFGDHGQQLGEHNLWEKMTTFEVGTRVPLIISAPWKRPRVPVQMVPVELVDLYRTLAELAGLSEPPESTGPTDYESVQGKSLAPLLVNDRQFMSSDRWYAFSQVTRCFSGQTAWGMTKYYPCLSDTRPLPDVQRNYNFMGYSVRSSEWRLTEWFAWNHTSACPVWEARAAVELYDHRNDTELYDMENFENENVAEDPAHREVLANLVGVIRASFGEGCPKPRISKNEK